MTIGEIRFALAHFKDTDVAMVEIDGERVPLVSVQAASIPFTIVPRPFRELEQAARETGYADVTIFGGSRR